MTFRKEILPDVEANLLAIPRKQRAMVRKGIKNGLDERDRRDGRPLLRAVRRQRPPPRHAAVRASATSRACAQVFGDDCEVLTVVDAQRPAGERRAVLLFPRRGAALLRRRHRRRARARRQRLQVLGAHAARLRARRCASSTTAAASSGTGSFDFKKNWGFEPAPLAYEYRLFTRDAIPQNNPLNPEVPGVHRAVAAAAASRSPTRSARTSCATSAEAARDGTVLYLVHRIPYPPNKGDKVRSFHLLQFLAARYRVHLGTFVDDPADLAHVERTARILCASSQVIEIGPKLARMRSLPASGPARR